LLKRKSGSSIKKSPARQAGCQVSREETVNNFNVSNDDEERGLLPGRDDMEALSVPFLQDNFAIRMNEVRAWFVAFGECMCIR
jgi:hypothetical protein